MHSKDIITILEKQERKKLFSRLQAAAEEKGDVPPMPSLLLPKMAHTLQYTGGALLGISIGIFILFFNFMLLVWLLHLEF